MKCGVCHKDFEKKHHNQKYCSRDCAWDKVNNKPVRPCEICGFDKITEKHHIIKRQDYGSDEDTNIVYLCPNHHKMADSIKYEDEIKRLIFEKINKIGEILSAKEIQAIEQEIALRVGGFEYKNHYCWYSTKQMLINCGEFYRIARNSKIVKN